ncbi:MAG: hypothetical protein H6719_17335 [Sandaracinaceae bacterium]|nr:hypothetical protein [Sandaracinaceae bacterium]
MTSWQAAGPGIWRREYSFGNNPMNTIAVDMGDGGLMAISPGTGLKDADFDALDALGDVRALVSPGAFHHMGMPAWSARYPDAEIFGPTGAPEHIAKQHKSLRAVQPLSALEALLTDDIEVGELAGCKFPDIFLALRRDGEVTWFSNEILTNFLDYPPSFMFRTVFKLFGTHPGLNVNTLAAMLIRAKKPVVRSYLEGKLESAPPTRLVPVHGGVLEDPDLATKIGEVLARRF